MLESGEGWSQHNPRYSYGPFQMPFESENRPENPCQKSKSGSSSRREFSGERNRRFLFECARWSIIHLYQAWESQESGRISLATIWQALQEQGIDPLPSRRTIYRIVQRHSKEANRDAPHRQLHRSSEAGSPGAVSGS